MILSRGTGMCLTTKWRSPEAWTVVCPFDGGGYVTGAESFVDAGVGTSAIQQYDNLRDRKVELVFGRLPTPMTEPDLVAEPLFDGPNVVVAGSESRWAKRRNLTLADLIGEPWVLAQPGRLARSPHDEVFRKNGLEPPSATVLTVSLHLYVRLIETGRWLGLVPASVRRFGRSANASQGSTGQSVIALGAGRVHHSQGTHANPSGGAFY